MIQVNRYEEKLGILAYSPTHQFLGTIDNSSEWMDFRLQIQSEKAEGYYVIIQGEKIEIDSKGMPEEKLQNFNLFSNLTRFTGLFRNIQLNLDGSYTNYKYVSLLNPYNLLSLRK